MKIVLATGIYPPDIGGPATYVPALARTFADQGHDVSVIAYEPLHKRTRSHDDPWPVVDVPRRGKDVTQWDAYADALAQHAHDADVVYAFSSVSVGAPLKKARLARPKKFLRLGGDFFWERYTARGGTLGLPAWYRSWHWTNVFSRPYMTGILNSFDHLVFSTDFQRRIYEQHYGKLPPSVVLENAAPRGIAKRHRMHTPFRLLFMGRFVGFKNIPSLLEAMTELTECTLTLTGEGPMSLPLVAAASELRLNDRVTFVSPVHGEKKDAMVDEHDALIIPSVTEISPNVALEARSRGLPVLLSDATGLRAPFTDGMRIAPLLTPVQIVTAVRDLMAAYDTVANAAAVPSFTRSWEDVALEHLRLFSQAP